jgi:hypothetical protein
MRVCARAPSVINTRTASRSSKCQIFDEGGSTWLLPPRRRALGSRVWSLEMSSLISSSDTPPRDLRLDMAVVGEENVKIVVTGGRLVPAGQTKSSNSEGGLY